MKPWGRALRTKEDLAKRLEHLCLTDRKTEETLNRHIQWFSLLLDFRANGPEAVQRIVDEDPAFCQWWVTHYIPEKDGRTRRHK